MGTTSLGDDFVEYFGARFLKMLGCELNLEKHNNWVTGILTERGRGTHPLHHILLQAFLNGLPKLKIQNNPFGLGPWSCPNLFADHGQEKTIKDIRISLGSDGKKTASAQCNCGFGFSFKETKSGDDSLPIVAKIIQYGPSWERKAKEYSSSGLSKREVAKLLGVQVVTAERLLYKKYTRRGRPKVKATNISGWREEWSALLKFVPDGSREKARKLCPKLYSMLYRYDREWFISQSSRIRPSTKGRVNVDWPARGHEYVEILRVAVKEIKEQAPPNAGIQMRSCEACGVLWEPPVTKFK